MTESNALSDKVGTHSDEVETKEKLSVFENWALRLNKNEKRYDVVADVIQIILGRLLMAVIVLPPVIEVLVVLLNFALLKWVNVNIPSPLLFCKEYLVPYALCVSVFFIGVGGRHRAKLESENSAYRDIDRQYQELLKLLVSFPRLEKSRINYPSNPSNAEYDAYAYMVWNLIETIYDNTVGSDKPEPVYDNLYTTWKVVVMTEGTRHAEWFIANCNGRFKSPFMKWVKEATFFNGKFKTLTILEPDAT